LAVALSHSDAFFVNPGDGLLLKRSSVRLFGRVKKGSLKKELAGIEKPKEPVFGKNALAPKNDDDDDDEVQQEEGTTRTVGGGGRGLQEVDELDQQMETARADAAGDGALDPDVQAGRRVLDPMTKLPYYLPIDDLVRLSICFPEADDALKASKRLDWSAATTPAEVKALLLGAVSGGNETMKATVLANYDYMGYDAALFLTGLKMNAQFRKSEEEVAELAEARKLYLIAMASLSCAFKQLMKDVEMKVGSVVNNFPAVERLGSELAEAEVSGCWFLLKAAVSTWEDKLMYDQRQVTRLKKEDPPNGSKIKKQEELVLNTGNNLALWQQMSGVFGESPAAQAKLLPEMRFLDKALLLPSETDVRFFAVQNFCSPESIGSGVGIPERELRERVRRLVVLSARLNPGNYQAVTGKIRAVAEALDEGTSDAVSYYREARAAGLCKFETYEMPLNDLSALREWEKDAKLTKRPKKKGDLAKKEPLEKPARSAELDWYNVEMETIEEPLFQRNTLDSSIEDAETWDTTIEVNEIEANWVAKASGSGFLGIPAAQLAELAKGLDGTPEELAEFDRKLAEDEALFETMLEKAHKASIGDKEWENGSQVLSAFDMDIMTPEGRGMTQEDFDIAMKEAREEMEAHAKSFDLKDE